MRKLFIVIALALTTLTLASCGAQSLTANEENAVKAVEKRIDALGSPQVYSQQQVIGQVAKDAAGNKVTLVYVNAHDKTQPKGQQDWSLVLIVVETQAGKIVFADAEVPSNIVTVQ